VKTTEQICQELYDLGSDPTAEGVAPILADVPREDFPRIIRGLEFHSGEHLVCGHIPSEADSDRTFERIMAAADHTKKFDQLTDSMAEWYDHEIQVNAHSSRNASPINYVTDKRYDSLYKIIRQILESQVA
jgi:hypothetical protein